jgi:hypothetical protein
MSEDCEPLLDVRWETLIYCVCSLLRPASEAVSISAKRGFPVLEAGLFRFVGFSCRNLDIWKR